MKPGTACTIARNVTIDGELVFRRGEAVTVEAIDPDPQAPGLKYVVTAPDTGKRVRLKGADLDRVYCEKCGEKLDRVEFECPHCGWVVPGREPEHSEKELEEYRRKMHGRKSNGGPLPPVFPI